MKGGKHASGLSVVIQMAIRLQILMADDTESAQLEAAPSGAEREPVAAASRDPRSSPKGA